MQSRLHANTITQSPLNVCQVICHYVHRWWNPNQEGDMLLLPNILRICLCMAGAFSLSVPTIDPPLYIRGIQKITATIHKPPRDNR